MRRLETGAQKRTAAVVRNNGRRPADAHKRGRV
jgi:hypothetical protein